MNHSRVASLEAKHGEADALLHRELTRPAPDPLATSEIKRRKLSLKDAIADSVH